MDKHEKKSRVPREKVIWRSCSESDFFFSLNGQKMNCIAQQDEIEKYPRALRISGRPQRRTWVVRTHVCPGVPSGSRELNPGGNVDAERSCQKLKSQSRSGAGDQVTTHSTGRPVWSFSQQEGENAGIAVQSIWDVGWIRGSQGAGCIWSELPVLCTLSR